MILRVTTWKAEGIARNAKFAKSQMAFIAMDNRKSKRQISSKASIIVFIGKNSLVNEIDISHSKPTIHEVDLQYSLVAFLKMPSDFLRDEVKYHLKTKYQVWF